MSEQLPHNEQWDDLPLPDENIAWQKMKILLDEDKRRRFVPFWFWRYAALSLLVIGSIIGGWLLLRSENEKVVKKNDTVANSSKKNEENKKSETVLIQPKNTNDQDINFSIEKTGEDKTASNPSEEKNMPEKKEITTQEKIASHQNQNTIAVTKTISKKLPRQGNKNSQVRFKKSPAPIISKESLNEKNEVVEKPIAEKKKDEVIDSKKDEITISKTDSTKKTIDEPLEKTITKDSIVVTNPSEENNKKEAKNKKKPLIAWSAGIGLQQAIALHGQQTSSYNYSGKRSGASDYIPSVYVRLQKGKWYLQAEGNYSVPQPVKNVAFSQATKYDATNFKLKVEKFYIEKVYYHQLPISINYSPYSSWSLGAGMAYNILAGAITTKELQATDIVTNETTVTRTLAPVKGFKDSFLYKTTVSLLLQTDYHWKRFSLGLRYTKNLQPFIKYTKPDGEIVDEKNGTLQAILRFRLF